MVMEDVKALKSEGEAGRINLTHVGFDLKPDWNATNEGQLSYGGGGERIGDGGTVSHAQRHRRLSQNTAGDSENVQNDHACGA